VERNLYRGCLVGHAVGDALGAPVEFMSRLQIIREVGPDGVRGFLPWTTSACSFPPGSYTDDTQMMFATATALLDSLAEWRASGIDTKVDCAYERYLAWRGSQDEPGQARRPGQTCLASLRSGRMGTIDDPINDRKGSGGIMRVAPIGLAAEPERAFEIAAEVAAITHGHPSGYVAAGFYADVIARLLRGSPVPEAVAEARELLLGWEGYEETLDAVDLAVELYISDVHPVEAIRMIGEGWIAEEALGIALLCAMSYPEDWEEGTLAAVNITGDSDTTGALTGALLGVHLGVKEIPAALVRNIEDSGAIHDVADKLFDAFAVV